MLTLKLNEYIVLAIVLLAASVALLYYQRRTTQIRQTEAIRQFVRDENREQRVLGKTEWAAYATGLNCFL